ncbi:MAG: hypothetical protein GY842_21860 [bacterium]|nr:hypothetical protein [bacterium]
MTTQTLETLKQHELVILRRLREGPLTEFELASEVAAHSGWNPLDTPGQIVGWLEALRDNGLVWTGRLYNDCDQYIYAAALTNRGRDLVG